MSIMYLSVEYCVKPNKIMYDVQCGKKALMTN